MSTVDITEVSALPCFYTGLTELHKSLTVIKNVLSDLLGSSYWSRMEFHTSIFVMAAPVEWQWKAFETRGR